MNLSPRQLRVVVTLAGTLHFGRAADALAVTQPTLTKLVRDIEEVLSVRLFERTTRSVRLTPLGEELLPMAARLLAEYEAGLSELDAHARRGAQRLAVAALPTLAAMLLPAPVATLRRRHPHAVLRVHDVFNEQALDLLRARKVDIALSNVDVVHQDLAYAPLLREPFVALTPRRQRHGLGRRWSEPELARLPLIAMPRGTGTRQVVEAAFLRCGVPFRPSLELHNLVSIARFVKAGAGVALLPLLGALLVLDDDLRIHRLDDAPTRTIGAVTPREARAPALASEMLGLIGRHARALGRLAGQA